MAETTAARDTRARRGMATLAGILAWALALALGLVVAAELAFFAIHAAQLLSYPYPLDYGEGPLLAQVGLLRAGTPIWRLYADPGAPPYAVVNYPPVYHLTAALLSLLVGNTLLAGRLISVAAALASAVALWLLSDGGRRTKDERQRTAGDNQPPNALSDHPRSLLLRTSIVLAFLGLPIVREWAALMRVDMLGVCLGLWGLALVQRERGRRGIVLAALLLALSLFVKPSLLAAPAAALLWLAFRDWRRALLLGLLLAALGGLAFGLLQLGSGGWFASHVLAANANEWQFKLAHGFWHDQLAILWPLLAPAALLALSTMVAGPRRRTQGQGRKTKDEGRRTAREQATDTNPLLSPVSRLPPLLPLYYTLFGAIGAFGVGKVGAYANYFLEFYAGLIWIAALVAGRRTKDEERSAKATGLSSIVYRLSSMAPLIAAGLVIGALLRYYPLWSETYLKPYGMIEQANPPRVAFGQYGVWRDLERERAILATLGGVNAALVGEVRAAGAPIFTDVPGVAAQAGQHARLQAFEHRQLLDGGQWDQRPLLRDLASGRVPLVVLDYLGNWLSPEMIALITHRYAQDGSRGTYDIYRPVDPGPAAAADIRFPAGPRIVGYHLALAAGRPIYQPGETVLLTLDWRNDQPLGNPTTPYTVTALLADEQGNVLLETARPLLYGALPPRDWGADVVQHLQPIALPPELPAGAYRLEVTLRDGEGDLAPPRAIAPLVVADLGGRLLGEQGYFVPEPFLGAWRAAEGYDGPGDPLMPATPFHGYTLQCFALACWRLDGSGLQRLPLGELIRLLDAGLPAAPPDGGTAERFAETGQSLSGPFLDYWRANGGLQVLGPPVGGELLRGDQIVQYTRYARLERPQGGGEVRQGRLGDEYLRLPGGGPYRWP